MSEKPRNGAIFLLLPAVAFVLLMFAFPFIYGLVLSFTTGAGNFTLDNFARFFGSEREVNSIWITLGIAVPVTLVNVGLSIPLAYYMRHGVKFEKMITFFLIMPITLGTVLVAQGMLSFMGPHGWLNQLLLAVLGPEGLFNSLFGLVPMPEPVQFTHNYWGVCISVFIQGFPFAFLMLLGYISGINPDLEKAGQMLGASKWQTFRKILFPLMVPGIAIAFCLNFVMAFSVFPSAVLLGQPSGPTRVIALSAYQAMFENTDFANAYNASSAVSMVMAFIEIAVIGIVLAWRSRIYKGASMVGKG